MTRVLVCALVLPEFDREAGSKRLFDLVELLLEAGCAVTFLAREPSGEQRYVRMLQQRGVPTYQGFDEEALELLMFGGFDLVIFGSWHVAEPHLSAVRMASPKTRVVVDAIDLHWLRNLRRHFLPKLPSERPTEGAGEESLPDYPWLMFREVGTYVAADTVFTVSEKEARIIGDMIGSRVSVHAVPLIEETTPSTLPFAQRRGIAFVGNFRHEPNQDAVDFFFEDVLPHLDSDLLEQHPVSIVGNEPTAGVLDRARRCRFARVVGWVPSLVPYLQTARISIVPLRYGAGTKGKLLQSVMAGTPVVSTSIGTEGLDLVHERHVLVADDGAGFARCIESLISDENQWNRLQRQGGAEIAKRHGREAVRARLLEALSLTTEGRSRAEPAPDGPRPDRKRSPFLAHDPVLQSGRQR
jgi:glycosyltransferase involved in cell wall biosynthesis